MQSVDS